MTASAKPVPPPSPLPTSLLLPSRFQDEFFWKGFRTSAAIHAVAAITAVVLGVSLSKEPVKFLSSIRVDLVALPDVKKSDIAKYAPTTDLDDLSKKLTEAGKGAKKLLEAAKKPIAEPKPEIDSMALKKEKPADKTGKDELKNAIERIKALAKIESEVRQDKPKAGILNKGNALSKGDSTTGGQAGDANLYIGRMQTKLRDNWNLPVWLTKQQLNAKVVIFLDRAGYVSNTVFAKSSGNTQFDDYCLKTIRMAQPFGPPPEEILDGGLTLGFPL